MTVEKPANEEAIERVRVLEGALQEAERLAVANRYAAAIMHEVNNPLEAITNLTYLLQQEELPPVAREYLNSLQEQITVLTAVTRPSLAFHREKKTPAVVNLRELVESIEKLHGVRLKEAGITLHRRCPETVICDVVGTELLQVLSNLILNAFEAVREAGKGAHIHIRVTCLPGSVYLLVADDGPGIPAHLESRLFEAHVSGKPHGSGLGLWISERIVQNHQGRMRVRTSRTPGRSGTAFRIVLPCRVAQERIAA